MFRCRPFTTSIHATNEARKVRWMTRDEIRQHMDPAFAIRALDAFEPGTQFRAHDGVHLVTSSRGR